MVENYSVEGEMIKSLVSMGCTESSIVKIGKGISATVFRAVHNHNDIAVKVILRYNQDVINMYKD
jgi:hypothetical protein